MNIMIEELRGKKVYSEEGDLIGVVEDVFVDELGYTIVRIKTEFEELPELRANVISLRKRKTKNGDIYILKSLPVKLKEILLERKREEEIRRLEAQLGQQQPIIATHVEEKTASIGDKEKVSIFQRILQALMNLINRLKEALTSGREK